MKQLLYILLLCVIIYNSYKNSKLVREYFIAENDKAYREKAVNEERKGTIVLLGDSTFKNNLYVGKDESIEYLLKTKEDKNVKTYCLAVDGARIKDVYKQFDNIPDGKNDIFLSVGGNNILDDDDVVEMFSEYKQLLDKLSSTGSKITVCNLYFPPNSNKIHDKITAWNNKINEYVLHNNSVGLLSLSKLLVDPDDFVSDYEPSDSGGEKIVKAIFYS